MTVRLPAHLEVGGLIRSVQAEGGFATVLSKGEKDAGTILVVCCEQGRNGAAYERLPQADGSRVWTLSRRQAPDNPEGFSEFLSRRQAQDPDLWIVELDIPNAERFIDSTGTLN